MTPKPDLMHSPGRTESDGITHCVLCGNRIFQNVAGIIRSRHPGEWGHIAAAGSEMGFLFTCPGPPEGLTGLGERVKDAVEDMVTNLLVYDRKEDEDLPQGAIEAAIKTGTVTIGQLVEIFRRGLTQAVP